MNARNANREIVAISGYAPRWLHDCVRFCGRIIADVASLGHYAGFVSAAAKPISIKRLIASDSVLIRFSNLKFEIASAISAVMDTIFLVSIDFSRTIFTPLPDPPPKVIHRHQ